LIAYIDASALLRVALDQPDALAEWSQIRHGVSSALVMTETLRTLDRLRLRAQLTDADLALRRSTALAMLAALDLVHVDAAVLERAAQPMPTDLATLDAIHLATALLWNQAHDADLVMATHDAALGAAAMAHGLRVVGIPGSR
jgi:predicted nucleic acid-binding protein